MSRPSSLPGGGEMGRSRRMSLSVEERGDSLPMGSSASSEVAPTMRTSLSLSSGTSRTPLSTGGAVGGRPVRRCGALLEGGGEMGPPRGGGEMGPPRGGGEIGPALLRGPCLPDLGSSTSLASLSMAICNSASLPSATRRTSLSLPGGGGGGDLGPLLGFLLDEPGLRPLPAGPPRSSWPMPMSSSPPRLKSKTSASRDLGAGLRGTGESPGFGTGASPRPNSGSLPKPRVRASS
ncbi:MAG TPA: hypothetical protein VEL76_12845 [Gemmataceae bacterium]|nr:hypothetical protein [Gemmataceae bacterium]